MAAYKHGHPPARGAVAMLAANAAGSRLLALGGAPVHAACGGAGRRCLISGVPAETRLTPLGRSPSENPHNDPGHTARSATCAKHSAAVGRWRHGTIPMRSQRPKRRMEKEKRRSETRRHSRAASLKCHGLGSTTSPTLWHRALLRGPRRCLGIVFAPRYAVVIAMVLLHDSCARGRPSGKSVRPETHCAGTPVGSPKRETHGSSHLRRGLPHVWRAQA